MRTKINHQTDTDFVFYPDSMKPQQRDLWFENGGRAILENIGDLSSPECERRIQMTSTSLLGSQYAWRIAPALVGVINGINQQALR